MINDFTVTQKRALAVLTVVALAFGAYFLRTYFVLIVIAAVAAYLFTRCSVGSATGWGLAWQPPAPCCAPSSPLPCPSPW